MMLPNRCCRSVRSAATAKIAITSDAAVMSNPSSRGTLFIAPPSPTTICRNARSFTSRQRRKVIRRGSIPSGLPWCIELSIAAASRLLAAVTACRSPVKCRLISSAGVTSDRPLPVPPPFSPITGPIDGSRRQTVALTPRRRSPCVKPMLTVVFPSPAVVGVIAVTTTRRPTGAPCRRRKVAGVIFAL